MKIKKICGYALSSPYGNGNNLGQPLGVKSIGIVEVHTDAGLIGIGETYSGVYVPELIEPVAEFIGARLIGLDPQQPEDVAHRAFIPFTSRNGLFCSVYSAIDIALWDIKGQVEQKPIHELLNPAGDHTVLNYASGGSGAMSPEEVFEDVERVVASGFHAYKMRVGICDWETDLRRVAAAREALGPQRSLMIDAIMGTISPPWTVKVAEERLKDLAQFKPVWLEEPLHPDDAINLKRLRGITEVSIAAGEALTGVLDFSAYFSSESVDIIQVDPTHCGGITIGKKVIDMAKERNIPVAMHVWGSSIAQLANASLAFSSPVVRWLEVPTVSFELSAQMPAAQKSDADREIAVRPAGPGLGVAINEDLKATYKMVPGSGYKL